MRNRAFLLLMVTFLALAACGGAGSSVEPGAVATDVVAQVEPTAETELNTVEAPAPATDEATLEAPATESPATEAAPEATAVPTVICPEVTRPALILTVNPGFDLHNPLTGERCALSLPDGASVIQPAGERIYFLMSDYEAGNSAVARIGPDDVMEPLEATRIEDMVHYNARYAVAADESRLAWSHMRAQEDPNATEFIGSLWVGAADGSDPVALLQDVPGAELRVLNPIRFSEDGSTLFFSWEPTGLGGMWAAFNSRYDNLYRVPVTGGEPDKLFDCADSNLFLCVGDFRDDGTLAYIDGERVIHVIGPDGAEMAAITTTGDYAGYPTFTPSGDLLYSEAVLPEVTNEIPLPTPGTVYRLAAPYTSAPEVVASANGLLASYTGRPFLGDDQQVVSYQQGEMWGSAMLNLSTGEITRLEPWPNAYLAAIWR